MAQPVEHVLGKDEVTRSNRVSSSKKHQIWCFFLYIGTIYRRCKSVWHIITKRDCLWHTISGKIVCHLHLAEKRPKTAENALIRCAWHTRGTRSTLWHTAKKRKPSLSLGFHILCTFLSLRHFCHQLLKFGIACQFIK